MNQPPPLRPIGYAPMASMYKVPARPGVVSFVGVTGMIFAILQIILNVSAIFVLIIMFFSAKIEQTKYKMLAASMQSASTVNTNSNTAPGGINDPQKLNMAVNGMLQKHGISQVRQQQLRKLLQYYGQTIFNLGDNLTSNRVGLLISDSGQMMLDDNDTLADYYELGTGRIEITDKQAIYRPSDGGKSLRSTDFVNDTSLSEDQIDTFVEQVGSYQSTNSKQEQALRTALRRSDQKIVTPPKTKPEESTMVTYATLIDNGDTLCIVTRQQQARINKAGQLYVVPLGTPMGTSKSQMVNVNMTVLRVLIGEAVVSLLLAVLLIVGAVILLKGRPMGRKLCITWAAVKIPLVLLAGWLLAVLMVSMSQNQGNQFSIGLNYVLAGCITVGCLCLPLVILFGLTRKSASDHFRGVM